MQRIVKAKPEVYPGQGYMLLARHSNALKTKHKGTQRRFLLNTLKSLFRLSRVLLDLDHAF